MPFAFWHQRNALQFGGWKHGFTPVSLLRRKTGASRDADNRIVRVETSREGYIWDTDARYKYYAHGPLARTELGHYRVQGSDYAYTLQGWIKGVNLPASEAMQEPGRDGTAMSSKDAYAYTLGYYQGDYQPIAAQYEASMPIGDGLYNGNISWMATDIQGLGAQGMAYKYDPFHVGNCTG